MEPTNGELSLRDIVGVAKKRRWLIAAVTLLTLAATMALTLIPAPDYRSDADVVVQDSAAQEALDDRFNSVSNLNRDLSNEAALAESDAVLGVLSRRTGRDLSEEVDVSFATDSDVLVFSAWSEFPQDSADLANAYAEQFINTKRAIALESLDDAIITLEERLVRSLEERLEVGRPIQEAELRLADASEGNQRSIQREIDRLSIELGPQLSRIDGRISSLSERLTRLEVEAELAGI